MEARLATLGPGRLVLGLLVALALAGCGSSPMGGNGAPEQEGPEQRDAALPAPDLRLPRGPARLAALATDNWRGLRRSIASWRRDGDPLRGGPPRAVTLQALLHQRIYVFLSARRKLARATLARLGGRLAAEARASLAARRSLGHLTRPTRRRGFRTGRALPADVLVRHYRRAQRRFGVAWHVLAAVNLVETGFNRIRSDSWAGAQGPMQFIPSTWRAYGMGGDVHDPRDAIMGAANYLRASGAPGDYRRALYAYNRSLHYVRAVLRYAERMRRDPKAYYAYYSWQVFVRTPSGPRRITGPHPR